MKEREEVMGKFIWEITRIGDGDEFVRLVRYKPSFFEAIINWFKWQRHKRALPQDERDYLYSMKEDE